MGRLPELAWDPADMPALRRKLAAMPEAHAFQDFELARVEIGPEAIRSLPAVLAARPRQGRAGRMLTVRGGDAPGGCWRTSPRSTRLGRWAPNAGATTSASWRAGAGPGPSSSRSWPTGTR